MLQALGAVLCCAVLSQHLKPVAFYSYKLNDAEQRSASGEQDLLAMVMGAEAMALLPRGGYWWPDSGN